MVDILAEIVTKLPKDAEISLSAFEGANLILYTKNKEFFFDNKGEIRKLVGEFKKRIELRPDPSISLDMEKAEKIIKETLPEDAKADNIIFDAPRSTVIIETEKPGTAIGKSGDILKEIKEKTLWVPLIRRTPLIRSKMIENIRAVLYENNDYRRKFLNEVGKRIYNGWVRGKKDEWVRITVLGAGRQVGRSCFLLQTQESRIILDCGINPAASEEFAYPHFDAPEFKISEIDAVIISHAHLDHCLPPQTPILLKNGSIKPIDDIQEGDELISIDFKTGKKTIGKCTGKIQTKAHQEIYQIRTPYFTIEASHNHKFFTVDNLEIKELRASELTPGTIIPAAMEILPQIKSLSLGSIAYKERVHLPIEAKKQLQEIRESQGLTQIKASLYAGMGVNFVGDLERKYNYCSKEHMHKLLHIYGIDTQKFFEENNIQETNFPEELTPELAQIVGYLTGDGHASSNYSIRATDKDISCLEEYKVLVRKVFNHTSIIRHHPDKTKNAFIIEINNAGIKRFIHTNFESTFYKSKEKLIPQKITFSSQKIMEKFIRGLGDAEGSVNQNIVIASSSIEMLESLQFMLSSIGIPATLDLKWKRICISSLRGLKKYEEHIGFSHPKKAAKLKELINKKPKELSTIQEVLPISSQELNNIFNKAGIQGKAKGSINVNKLPSSIVDWKRRAQGYPERKTVQTLLKILAKRVKELEKVQNMEMRIKRIALSMTLQELSKSTQCNVLQIQVRERINTALKDDLYTQIDKKLTENIQKALIDTKTSIQKIKKLMKMPICWQKITTITKKENPYPYLVDIEVEPTRNFIAQGVLVHNSAMVPLLVKYGYQGPIYCTEPTRDIMSLLALDFISIGFKDVRKTPFDIGDVKQMVKQTICIGYEEVTDITPDIRLTFYNAGHILGSAMSHLHIGNGLHNMLYTGDMLYDNSNLLAKAITKFPRLETVIIESTYGSKDDVLPPREESEAALMDIIKKTIERGGKILLPVLGVGRSQEIMIMVERAFREGTIPQCPIYVQGMVWDVTAIHTAYPEFFNAAMRKQIFYESQNPFTSEIFKRIGSQKEMHQVMESGEPGIIIATSGMLTGGASVEYFKVLAENPKHSVILTSYQAEGSLGRRIQNGEKEIAFASGENRSEVTKVRCEIYAIKGFSGHSSRPQLLAFLRNLEPKPKRVITQHGESSKCLDLASTAHKLLHVETSVPRNLDSIRLV
ncbi:MBL fold metallo-hydrolase [Candidatus Woesearchaeota archaeon]|nr:MBL fold metallo-hydrolase [Candidatus Woesearchaeota archaeon]